MWVDVCGQEKKIWGDSEKEKENKSTKHSKLKGKWIPSVAKAKNTKREF